ncbi:uncharacterized protein LOC128220305 [Mya arenaria]|uniref:uncharacterized protein LOC128220305 n=1 Tax=Mya arenaria TaxID=6604 RepID=UPI0022E0E635|nr:uncharacterized protein LOC128220305 [Mya arenaria]
MSVMFRRVSTVKRPMKQSSEINKRDMSLKKKVLRRVQELPDDGKIQVTSAWNIDVTGQQFRVAFSRDNLHVWINGKAVETTSYITDKGYDVDLFFKISGQEGHIFSDVEGAEMINYLLVEGEMKGQDYQVESSK